MADQAYTVNVADPELALRDSGMSASKKRDLTAEEAEEKKEIDNIVEARKRYEQDRKSKEQEWTESYKMYMSWMDKVVAPFISNLFIPKTHEAVELLASYLIGRNQSINASPENGSGDTMKAKVAGKYLENLWKKVLKARLKILVWIKQGIVFGNGIMKFGWDSAKKKPWMGVCAIEDVYFDYFEPDIQDSEYLIHEIRRDKADVVADEKYDLKDKDGKFIREQVVEGGQAMTNTAEALFNTFDGSHKRSENKGKVLVMEVWCKGTGGKEQYIKTLVPTSIGWRVARRAENPNKWHDGSQFRPFSKLRFKLLPIPNRAYDISMVWPTVGIQKAFNDLHNEYFDAVSILGNPTWLKRRGARINPSELVRRAGGIITVSDINKDLKREPIGDIPQSVIEMLNRLDREFQAASMITTLLKQFSDTATGDALEQTPLQTQRDMINQNIVDALSEAGQMVLAISLSHTEGRQSVKLWETDAEVATIEFNPKEIDGMHDIKIAPDQDVGTSKAVQNKQLIDFIKVVLPDAAIQQQYPSLKKKVYTRFLENGGIGDADYFFEEAGNQAGAQQMGPEKAPEIPMMQLPGSGQGLNPENIAAGANKVLQPGV